MADLVTAATAFLMLERNVACTAVTEEMEELDELTMLFLTAVHRTPAVVRKVRIKNLYQAALIGHTTAKRLVG